MPGYPSDILAIDNRIYSGRKAAGFTIVELLIVIVVIAILAAISIVAYNGIQNRARNSARQEAVSTITKALELYYTENGFYPNATTYSPGSTKINSSWSTTADGSWTNLETVLKRYVSRLPTPPTSSAAAAISGGDNFDYYGFANATYCGSSTGQGYLLTYHLDGGAQTNTLSGTCSGTQIGPYAPASNYRMVK